MKVSRVCGRVATRPKMTITAVTAVIVAVQSNMSNNRPQQMNATDQQYTKKAIQERAFRDLISGRQRNGGKPVQYDIRDLVKKYGHLGVNRQNLHYQLRKYHLRKSEAENHYVDGIVGLDVNVVDSLDSAISPLTEPEERITILIERPKKNSKKRALEEEKVLKSNLTTLASERFKGMRDEAARNGKYVEKYCLRNIIREIEAAHDIPENTLNHATIRKRVLVNNTSGKQHAS
jgi:hypothetical protein